MHWCRRRLRFNEVPEKVPKVPEKVWEALVQEPGHVQQGSGEGSGECLGGFGAEPGQVQKVPEKVPVKVWEASVQSQVRFNRVPEKVPKVPEKVWEALVQSQVRFKRVPEKAPENVGEALVQSQVRFNRVPEKAPENVWEALMKTSTMRTRSLCLEDLASCCWSSTEGPRLSFAELQ